MKKNLLNKSRKHGIIDNGKHKNVKKKRVDKQEYHVKQNKYFDNQDMKMYCATNQFPELNFLGPHNKPNSVCGLGNNIHMSFDPKLGHVTYAIRCISCACTS